MGLKEEATSNETRKHIAAVSALMSSFIKVLLDRAECHDRSKLFDPELAVFTEMTEKLAGCTYGSEEYKGFLAAMKPALDHHYDKNAHHPEHYPNGIDDMTLADIVEMFIDWKAATLRTRDGDIMKSIDINEKRFNMSPQLAKIFRNTAKCRETDV